MRTVSKSPEVFEVSTEGGISPDEADELADLDPSVLENGNYDPEDIPALAAYIHTNKTYENAASQPAEDVEEYVQVLLEDPDEVVPEWDIGDYPFENNSTIRREKRDEYTIRTLYAFEDLLDQELIDEALRTIAEKPDYRKETAPNSADGNLGILLGQYISQIKELTYDEDIIQEVYSTITQTSGASATAAANMPVNEFPEEILENIYPGGQETETDQITTRLRNMQGAGKCGDLETRHEKVLLSENPTRNTSLITINDELVGSLKHEGSTSMLALQDLTSDGKQVLQKGMTYKVSHPMLDQMKSQKMERQKPSHEEWEEVFQTDRMEEEQEEYSDWQVKEVDRLELRPLRFAGEKGDKTVEEFRQQIEEQRQELEELLIN